jgi:hypothetical protein
VFGAYSCFREPGEARPRGTEELKKIFYGDYYYE